MSSKTTNYNLHKIDLTDAPPDITVLNQNWDAIDTTLKNLDDKAGLYMRGWNPIDDVSKDTPSYWKSLGNGYWLVDYANVFIGQPSQWGFFTNMVQGEEVAQTFIVQASGETYRRNANGLGWYGNDWREGTWVQMRDDLNTGMDLLWTNASPTSAFNNQNISLSPNYSHYVILTNSSSSNNFTICARGGSSLMMGFLSSSSYRTMTRFVNVTPEGVAHFYGCTFRATYGGEGSSKNEELVPTEIYGVNL